MELMVHHYDLDVITAAESGIKSGTYEGHEIEGLVIRCQSAADKSVRVFFKIKFPDPYLLYREWREVTKAIISGNNFRVTYDLSNSYAAWVQKLYYQTPNLFDGYLQNKGISRIRNMFLIENNMSSMQLAELSGNCEVIAAEKVLIIPIGTIGAGKTTLGRALTKLFSNIGHIQNDNMIAGTEWGGFQRGILDEFKSRDIVFADRNNHKRMHRKQLFEMFSSYFEGGRIVVLDWGLEKLNPRDITRVTTRRVEARGTNHQSLIPNGKHTKIINNFVYHRDPFSIGEMRTGIPIHVISLDLMAKPAESLIKICEGMSLKIPDHAEIDSALDYAFRYQELIKK